MLAKYKPLRANVSRAEVSTCFYVVSESTITTNHLAKTHLVAVLGLLKGVALSSSRTDPGGGLERALSPAIFAWNSLETPAEVISYVLRTSGQSACEPDYVEVRHAESAEMEKGPKFFPSAWWD